MPAPLVAAAGAGIWTAGRWAIMRGIPLAAKGIGSLFRRKMSVGGAVALAAAPTIVSVADGLTGHALSESLVNTPLAPALQAVLSVHEFSKDQQAGVISNLINNELTNRNVMNENDPDYARSQQLVDAIGHMIVNDPTGAVTAAGDLNLNPSDIVAAYNKAKEDNPEGSLGTIGAAAFNDLKNTLRERDAQPSNVQSGLSLQQEMLRVQSLSGSSLLNEFNAVVQSENLGLGSSFNMFAATILDVIGFDSAANYFKKKVVLDNLSSKFNQAAGGAESQNSPEAGPRIDAPRASMMAPAPG